jgi:hypothetical protein
MSDNEKHRIYMRAVHGVDSQVLGFYEPLVKWGP